MKDTKTKLNQTIIKYLLIYFKEPNESEERIEKLKSIGLSPLLKELYDEWEGKTNQINEDIGFHTIFDKEKPIKQGLCDSMVMNFDIILSIVNQSPLEYHNHLLEKLNNRIFTSEELKTFHEIYSSISKKLNEKFNDEKVVIYDILYRERTEDFEIFYTIINGDTKLIKIRV